MQLWFLIAELNDEWKSSEPNELDQNGGLVVRTIVESLFVVGSPTPQRRNIFG
jgi:hypothetical protein